MSAASPEKLILLDKDALKTRTEDLANADSISKGSSHTQWGPNEIPFEALCRMLDIQVLQLSTIYFSFQSTFTGPRYWLPLPSD